MKNKIFFASTNKRKIDTYAKRLSEIGWELVSIPINIPESRDFSVSDVAIKKLEYAKTMIVDRPLFVEDRGLKIKGLNSFPGSNIKIVTDLMGVPKLMDILDNMDSEVEFTYSIAFAGLDDKIDSFEGQEKGVFSRHDKIHSPKSLFDVYCSEKFLEKPLSILTDSEMYEYEKHWTRSDALCGLIEYLKTYDRDSKSSK